MIILLDQITTILIVNVCANDCCLLMGEENKPPYYMGIKIKLMYLFLTQMCNT